MTDTESILIELRVPDLPYPVRSNVADDATDAWGELLEAAWRDASDERVVEHLKAHDDTFTLRQVNAGYLADRIMNVFLRRSGLHSFLVHRAARLRFWLALDLDRRGDQAASANSALRRWLDSLESLQGWSRTGGRSDRWMIEQLEGLEHAVSEAFSQRDTAPLDAHVERWTENLAQQGGQARRIAERLWRTEKGAAGQRAAENAVRAALARSCRGRRLPQGLRDFLENDWRQQMRSIALESGVTSEPWRHAHRLLEWLVWVGDPELSDQDRNRLYQVGEQLTDKLSQLVRTTTGEAPDPRRFEPVDTLLGQRMRDEAQSLVQARFPEGDPRWLNPMADAVKREAARWQGSWYLRYEEGQEIRQFFFGFLEETGEVLWTNAQGAKLGLQSFCEVREMLETGQLNHLPAGQAFGRVLEDTLRSLERVLESQRRQRARARERARLEAEALRLRREQAREEQARLEAERLEREEAQRREAEVRARDEEESARQAEELERQNQTLEQVDKLVAGGWIEVGTGEAAQRLKLALRISTTGKLVFVDRFGLNRKEIMREELMRWLMAGEARILSEGVAFADTLSRVTGRLRVGGSQ